MLTAAELNAMPKGQIVVDNEGDDWKKISTDSLSWQCTTSNDDSILTSDELVDAYFIRRKETHVEQPMPTASTGASMHDLAIQVHGDRAQIGLARYGQPLQAMNGRDAVRDTIEELADGLAYALQIREERRLLRAELTALMVALADDGVGAARTLDSIIDRYFPES